MEWEESVFNWVLKGDYPAGIVWVFIGRTLDDQYHWLIVKNDRSFAEGFRFSFDAAQSAVSEHLARM